MSPVNPLPFAVPPSHPPSPAQMGVSTLPPPRAEPTREELYFALGVSPGTQPAGLKRAYKKLALKYHPDVSDDPDAALKFQRIQEAYNILKAGGGTNGQQWWKYRWTEQLHRIRQYDKVKSVLRDQAVAAAGGEEAEQEHMKDLSAHFGEPLTPEEQRGRWEGQLAGLKARAAKRRASDHH